jgi:hypothetical protein
MNELELLSRYGTVEPIDPALIDATVQAIVDSPERTPSARHRSSSPRRRRAARLILAAVSAAAAAAVAVTLSGAGGPPSPRPPRPAPQAAQSYGNVLTAYVVQHSLAALETASGYVERVVRQDGSGIRISWIGPNQLLDQVPDQTTTLWTWAATGADTVLRIDYQQHTWSRSVFPAPPPPRPQTGRPPSPAAVVSPPKALTGPEPSAASIAALFRQPGTQLVGTATVDGTFTYELWIPALDSNGKAITGKAVTAWVDAQTYLPVRIMPDLPPGQGPNTGFTAGTPAEDFTWQPATPQALAVFDLEPPAGFHQITDPALQPVPPGG